LEDAEAYKSHPEKIARTQTRVMEVMDELLKAYERWEYLEGLKDQGRA
jgi:hypothetical protein